MSSFLDNEFPLRTETDVDEIPNCALCSRVLKRVESHWHCIICRKSKAEAKCPKNCKACTALYEDKWRFSALSKSEKESLKKKLFLSKLGINEKPKISPEIKKPSEVIHLDDLPDHKCSIESSLKHEGNDPMDIDTGDKSNSKKTLIKSRSKGAKTKILAKDLCSKSVKKNVKVDKSNLENRLDDPFVRRLQEFQTFLYQDLIIDLSDDLVCDGFKMPEVPSRLMLKFNVTKNEMIRLLATASISFHLSKNIDQIGQDRNLKMLDLSHVDNEFIGVELFASLIKFKANALAQVIFQIRESILSKVFCKDESIIPMMIRGPINPEISFFGNLDALQKAVEHDRRNVLTLRNEETRLSPESKKRKMQN